LFHGKNYSSSVEDKFRLKIFTENKAKIARHNALYHQGEKSYSMKVNSYADLLHHEFLGMMNGFNYEQKKQMNDGITQIVPAHVELPDEVDWRAHGAVTDVKNQGQCGSCWAFSTTGALEGQHFRKTGKLVSLSEQNLVDCSASFGNNGCNGGLMDNAFRYIKANGGIDTETAYPYDGEEEQCHFSRGDIGATDKGFVDITQGDEEALKAAIATVARICCH
jgi:cathepsin L